MGVRVKKVSKTKIAVKASTPSAIRSVLRRLGVDPELAKGDQKKMDPAQFQAPGSGRNTTSRKSTAKKGTARKSTAKKATARKSTAKKGTARKSTAKKGTARKSTAKKGTARKSTAKRATVRKSTARVARKGGGTRRRGPSN